MTSRRFLFLLPVFILPLGARAQAQADDNAQMQMKCGANQDRVWVYDSLTALNVEAKLKCGDAVEIVSRVKGYVKIRSSNGIEGYVPDSVFPDLPPLPPSPDESVAGSALANAAANNRAAVVKDPLLETKVATPVQRPAVAAAVTPAQPAPESTIEPAPASPHEPTVVAKTATVVAAAPTSVPVAAVAKPSITPSLTQPIARPAAGSVASEAPVVAATTASPAIAETPSASIAPPAVQASAPVMQAKAAAAPAPPEPTAGLTEAKMDVNPAVVLQQPKMKPALIESEDYPDTEPENESADPACHIYFSAYGLSPSQFKWIAANRKKEYPGICPAPNVASVDFVILFTHDSDTYAGAMPEPVHTDHGGFSDFNPLTTVDSALLSGANADKAHREYVWVFQMKRGGFDPARFSPRRRPQFTTVESKGSARALEDAFGYVQEQGTAQVAANH
jgi:hypothetical protein